MQAQIWVGAIPISNLRKRARRRGGWAPIVAAAEQNHYAVLGLSLSASSADIKSAYRFLARKYHPDVSKDSQASELFKSVRLAYEVLSNEATRTKYDRVLKFREDTTVQHWRQWDYEPELDDQLRIYRWDELKRRMRHKQYWEDNNGVKEESPSFSNQVSDEGNGKTERGPFSEVLISAFFSLFLLQTFGSRLSLTFSSIMALLDRKMDAGYKMGYLIAWILGGRGGIVLSLCLSFTSWACGKASSSIVALVVVAMWVGSSLARFVPLPQGALLTLLYMSIKLQVDLN